MWTSLFEAIAEGFKFLTSIVSKNPSTSDSVDAAAARHGTAAGAAANEASHRAGNVARETKQKV